MFQAIGGVLTSLCIQYADNIAKNFATSISIIISFIFSLWFFGYEVSNPVSYEISFYAWNSFNKAQPSISCDI